MTKEEITVTKGSETKSKTVFKCKKCYQVVGSVSSGWMVIGNHILGTGQKNRCLSTWTNQEFANVGILPQNIRSYAKFVAEQKKKNKNKTPTINDVNHAFERTILKSISGSGSQSLSVSLSNFSSYAGPRFGGGGFSSSGIGNLNSLTWLQKVCMVYIIGNNLRLIHSRNEALNNCC